MGTTFRYDQTFDFAVGRDVLWDALTDTAHFQTWWPWLRSFDAVALTPGAVATCAVRGPLPYTLTFEVHVERVDVGRSVDTQVTGDLSGPARLEVASVGPGAVGSGAAAATSTARLAWAVDLKLPMLSAAAHVARPLLVWAHDHVVSSGVEQFRRHALPQPQDLEGLA